MKMNDWLDRSALGRRAADPVQAPDYGTGATAVDRAAATAQDAARADMSGGMSGGGGGAMGGAALADALDAIRALAMTAAAAEAELDAIEDGSLTDEDGTAEIAALDRAVKAEAALVLAVRAADAGLALLAQVERGRARIDGALKALRGRQDKSTDGRDAS